MPETKSMKISWCQETERTDEIVDFFIAGLDTSYISHGEVLDGRAIDLRTWSPELHAILRRDVQRALSGRPGKHGLSVAVAEVHPTIQAMGLAEWVAGHKVSHVILHDLVVAQAVRSQGIGSELMLWLEDQARELGCRLMSLETGVSNAGAQRFFNRHGFTESSLTFIKDLRARRAD